MPRELMNDRALDAKHRDHAFITKHVPLHPIRSEADYDAVHYPGFDVDPSDMLRFLMDQHGLKQSDLAAELGSQGIVSEILNGKRELNLRQMRDLARRFAVPVKAFVVEAN